MAAFGREARCSPVVRISTEPELTSGCDSRHLKGGMFGLTRDRITDEGEAKDQFNTESQNEVVFLCRILVMTFLVTWRATQMSSVGHKDVGGLWSVDGRSWSAHSVCVSLCPFIFSWLSSQLGILLTTSSDGQCKVASRTPVVG